MNDWSSKEFEWDDFKEYDRGKVLSKEDLEEVEEFGRYLDVDGDGVPYRTYPGTHPQKGAYFTRGTSHDEYARYTEDGVFHFIEHMLFKGSEKRPKPELISGAIENVGGLLKEDLWKHLVSIN